MAISIKKRLILYFLCATLIPLLTIFFVGFSFLQSSSEKKIVNEYFNKETEVLDYLEKMVFDKTKQIRTWSKLSMMEEIAADDSDGKISNILEKFDENDETIFALVAVNEGGKIVSSSKKNLFNKEVKNFDGVFSEQLNNNDLSISKVYKSKLFNRYIILVTLPLSNDGVKLGTLGVAIDWEIAFKMVDKVKLIHSSDDESKVNQNKDAFMIICGKDKFFISAPRFMREQGNIILNKKCSLKQIDQEQKSFFRDNGKIYVFAKGDGHKENNLSMNSLGWYSVISIDQDVAFEDLNSFRTKSWIFVIVITIIVFGFSYYISNKFTVPILKVAGLSKQLAQGNLNIEKIDVTYEDELGQLSSAFNNLIENQQQIMEQAELISNDDLYNKKLDMIIEGDLGRAFDKMKNNLRELSLQAQAIADDDLNNDILRINGKGTLSKAFSEMVIKLKSLTEEAHLIASDDLYNKKLSTEHKGTLGFAFSRMTKKLRFFAELAKLIADGKLSSTKLELENRGVLGKEFFEMIANLKKLVSQAAAIAEAKLDSPILSEPVKGELGSSFMIMTKNLKNMILDLENIISRVKSVSVSIDAVTNTVISSADDFLNNSKKQSVLSSDTDTALTEFSYSVQEISKNCDKGTNISNKTMGSIKNGLGIMSKVSFEIENLAESIKSTSTKLQELNESSRKISQIIDIITNISEKTALLALNAAIEAARAGESGRGFAVVADEVNKLAEQTNKSVKEISMLVETIKTQTELSVDSMKQGDVLIKKSVELVGDASDSLNEINNSIGETNESIVEISSAVKEQTSVIDNIVSTSCKLKEISNLIAEKSEALKAKGDELNDNSKALIKVLNKE